VHVQRKDQRRKKRFVTSKNIMWVILLIVWLKILISIEIIEAAWGKKRKRTAHLDTGRQLQTCLYDTLEFLIKNNQRDPKTQTILINGSYIECLIFNLVNCLPM
jgi:hypothetical protein